MEDKIMGTIFEFFQYGSLVFSIFTIYFIVKRAEMNKQWLFDIPLLLLMIHGVFYYFVLFGVRLDIISPPQNLLFTPWSAILRFHGYATLLIIAIGNYMRERKKLWKY